jgi:thiosulfate/3-mercaptopyruvate sulfurtransferase
MSDTPLLVDAKWVAEHREVRIADVRWSFKGPSPREMYERGHIPGAVFVDLDTDLASHPGPGRHPFPSEEQFARLLSRLGIAEETHVVAYDDGNNSVAVRFWFMLRVHGHLKASLLDGGLKAWTEAGLPVTREEPRIEPAPLRKLRLDRSRIVDLQGVRQRGDSALLDARAAERYRGETEPIDKKAGHIPGALNAPWAANLTRDLRFRPPAELRDLYKMYKTPIVSCGSGVTACHDAFAMELAGLPPARLYVGSFSDWISDPARPVATGPEPE